MAQFNPQPFGKYYLVDKLAVGGMAEIFLAKPPSGATSGPSYLVIKRILPHYSTNAQFIDMFIDEAKISVQLEHENIVPVFDLGKVGDTYFLAMQFVAGQDLKAVVTRCRDRGVRLSYEHAAYLVAELLKGLDYAHKKTDRGGKPLNIVHRDISPQNVLVGYDGGVKITDFGIAKAESKLDSTQVGTLKGKFGYMAPEQVVAGGPALDHRSDIFAAGIILWELVTGHRLFSGTSEIEILERVRAAKFDAPSAFVPDVPRELERIIFRSLMKDRDKRYSTAYEMQVDLARFLENYAPQFNQGEMQGVMEELFSAEIALAKTRWNVVIGPVIDKTKVERGAAQESTRPDQTRVSIEAPEPQRTKVVTPAPAAPMNGPPPPRSSIAPTQVRRGATPPPMASPAVEEPRSLAGRTQVSAPAGPTLTPEDLFGDADDGGERTITNEVRSNREQQIARQPAPPPRTPARSPVRVPDPEPARSPARAPDPDFDSAERTTTQDTAALKRGKSGVTPAPPAPRRSPVRPWLALSFIAVLLGTGAALAYMGVIPNPFAAPMIEVTATVDALISIDGNVVLASGRNGTWRVGEGMRTIEVKRQGYEPIVKTVKVARGERVFVDATMVPLPDAVADIDVTTTPPGAQVYLDAELQEGVTPLTLHPKIGDHTMRVVHEGYLDDVRAFRAGKPGAEKPISVTLMSTIASVRVTTVPDGAEVSIDGESKGKTPLTVENLPAGRSVVLRVALAGYEPETRTVPLTGESEPIAMNLTLTAQAGTTPAPAATASTAPVTTATETPAPEATKAVVAPTSAPKPTKAALAPTPAPSPTPVLDKTKGYLTVDVPGGWAEVWVDGTQLTRKSPLERTEVAPGTHTLRLFNPVMQQEKILQIEIVAGKINAQRVPLDQ